jgi:hypothetical protein
MPTLKPDKLGAFSFQGVVQFEEIESAGKNSAFAVFRFDDGYSLRMKLSRSDLAALHAALAGWLNNEPAAKDEQRTTH